MSDDHDGADGQDDVLDTYALVELMGHRKLVGRVHERQIGGQVLLQVDVLDAKGSVTATPLFGVPSIYCITPTSRDWCIRYAAASAGAYQQPLLPYVPETEPPFDMGDDRCVDCGELIHRCTCS